MRHVYVFVLASLLSGHGAAQLLPETATVKLHRQAELVYRDELRARAESEDSARWQTPWPQGFVEHWRDRRVGAGDVLRWTHVVACMQPAAPDHAGPCPGTYSLALELPAPAPAEANQDRAESEGVDEFCVGQGALIGAVRIAGGARDGSEDCLGVLTEGCVRIERLQSVALDLHFATARISEPMQACAELHVQERLGFGLATVP